MLPKEHGAYGQLGFPLMTSLAVVGVTPPSLLAAGAAISFFLAHEPLVVLLGHRGHRMRHAELRRAFWLLMGTVMTATALGVLALDATAPAGRWAFAVPIPALAALLYLTSTRREKTSAGESIIAMAFAATAIPVCAAAGSAAVGVAIALVFGLLFVDFTLAVRVIVLRTRGGGNPRAVGLTRRATFAVAIFAGLLGAFAVRNGWLGWGEAVAIAPGVVFASVLAAFPPPATRLRRVGWTLIGVSALTSVLLIAAA
jgi:hypothetical protein